MWDYQSELDWELRWAQEGSPPEQTVNGAEEDRILAAFSRMRDPSSELRLLKVLRLRAAIANKSYKVHLDKLAESMLHRACRKT